MKNIILQKTRYLRALMLTMLVGLFAFSGYAQTFTAATPPAGTWYAGQEATATYEATGFDAGTTFIVWNDNVIDNGEIDEGETIYGSSTTQDASTDIDFTWGEAESVLLRLAAFSGNAVTGEVLNFERQDVTVIGSNSGSTNNTVTFDRASARSLTTNAVDLDTSEPVVLSFRYIGNFISGPDADNPVEVLYSTNGFSTAGTALTEDDLAVDEFEDIGQDLSFTLPGGAKSATTSFRIRQTGTVDYGTEKNWRVITGTSGNAITLEIGETYSNELTAGAFSADQNIQQNQIIIDGLLNAADDPATAFYPGDEVTIDAQLPNVDLTGISFVATLYNNNNPGVEYLLDGQSTPVKDNGTKDINVNGTIPTNIEYDESGFADWNFRLEAFEGSEPLFGLNEGVDFKGNTAVPADFTSTSTKEQSTGLTFDQAGERSILTPEYSISSVNGLLSIELARDNDRISPPDTDIIIEYTTDGTTFVELTSVEINSLPRVTPGDLNFLTVDLDAWPAGVVSNSTQFRIRQEANNGEELDAWVLGEISISNETNIISTIDEGSSAFTLPSPAITTDIIEIGTDGLAYPMEEYSFTYTIDEGVFPASTSASLILDREDDGLDIETDIIIGSVADITTASIDFTVPPIPASDYDVYLVSQNGAVYGPQTLSIYNNELQITNITFENPVLVAGEEFGTPGSGITVEYSVLGDAGSAAEIMLSIEDDDFVNFDERFVMITASNTINGTITGTLPTNFAYTDPANLQLSFGNSGVFTTSPFDQTVFAESFGGSNEADNSIITFEGNTTFNNDTEALTSAGTRAMNIAPQSIPYGGAITIDWNIIGSTGTAVDQDVFLQGSIDGGTTWVDIDELTMNSFITTSYEFDEIEIPNNLWSENTSLRIITNLNGESGFEENVVSVFYAELESPEQLNGLEAEEEFNIVFPTLSVDDSFDPDPSYIGQEYTATYNAIGFPAGTEFAAVIEQGDAFYVAGSSAELGAGSITFTMPIVLPLNEDDPNANYDFFIYPYSPATAGDTYTVGQTIFADMDEDFLINTGDINGDEDYFEMSAAGKREILTRAFDLSAATSATLSFDYYLDDDFEITANKNVVPRLEVSIDGGATFETINVEDLAPGEMSIYDEGLLYEDGEYDFGIEIPAEFLTEATHFRWSQPLNLGDGQQVWEVENIEIVLGGGNALSEEVYEAIDNEFSNIDINNPALADYTWVQTDLQDAVFNGESFGYSFDFRDGLDATTAELFPTGTTFEFYLFDGADYVEDPETGNPFVISSITDLGTAEAEVPFFVMNGNYEIRVAASIDNDGEKYYIVGDEESGVQPGNSTLDVFLRVARLDYQGDENATVYAGQDVTFSITLENDETNLSENDDLFANIIYDGTIVATQQGFGDITFPLPTDAVGNLDFELKISETAPLGEVGDEVLNGDLNDLEDEEDNFITLDNKLPVTNTNTISQEFDLGFSEGGARLSFDLSISNFGTQEVALEYSLDGGAWTSFATYSSDQTDRRVLLPFDMRDAGTDNEIEYRWRLEDDFPDGTTFVVSNVDIKSGNSGPASVFTPMIFNDNAVKFTNTSGRGLITTRDFTPAELEDATFLSFNVDFDQLPADLTANQYVVFEQSTDGGATYTELASYPEMDADMILDGDMFNYTLSSAMKENGVRFRWRQEEAKGNFEVSNIDINFGETLPFDAFNDDLDVVRQTIQITNVSETEACLDSDITLDYEIRGRFGADNVVTIDYLYEDGSDATVPGVEFNLVEGSDQLTFALPSDALAQGANNESFRFRLSAYDETTDNDFTVDGSFTETTFELVAPIDIDADFTLESQQLCDVQDVMATIVAPRDYFTYQIVNALTGEAIGDPLTYDPELGENEINLGELTDEVRLSLQVTSASSSGTTCNTITSTVERDLDVQPNYALFNGGATDATLVQSGTVVELCGTTVTLRASYYDNNGDQQNANAADVEWFRDNLQTPVGSNATLTTFNKSGDYFARITDGNCIYTTESITVNVAVRPDQPAITVASGDLVSCDEDNEVQLQGPEGFAVYSWTRDGSGIATNQRTITVSANGAYRLSVSNAAQANNCNLSNASDPVIVNTVANEDVFLSIVGFGDLQSGQVYDICDNNNTAVSVSGAIGNNNVTYFKDGAEYSAQTTTTGAVNITESGVYYAEVTAGTCVFTTPEVTFNVLEAPEETPVITATGDLTFCDGQGSVVLEGPEGFAYYQWTGVSTDAVTSSNTIEVTQGGTYSLQVGNVSADGAVSCLSPASNTITVNSRALPSVPRANISDNSCGDGPVTFVLVNASFSGVFNTVQSNVSYQLINAATDEPSGLAVTGNGSGNTFLTSDVITEETSFYIEATYADGSGCTVSYPETRDFTAAPNNVTLEVQGAQLIARYNLSNSGISAVRWYREGVLLNNVQFFNTSSSITINDAADYSVEVEYASGCVVTASSADIAGKVLGNEDAMAMKVVSYPNPAQADVTLNVNSQYMGKHEVIVTSMTGQIMMQSSFEKSSFEAEHAMDVANLEEGIYNVQIRHDGLTQNVRIIKQ